MSETPVPGVVGIGRCPGCDRPVVLLYEHERVAPPHCDDCFDRLTVASGDLPWELARD